jgi:heme/copper-type cytochrome/quinol oxidase subunit 2
MRQARRFIPIIAFALLLLLAWAGDASACPNCKEAIAAQGNGESLKTGYFWSILFMIAMPFSLLGTGTLMVVRAVKRGALPEF